MKKPVVITLTNHKGGVGKTTISCNLSSSICRLNKKSSKYKGLIIDFDPQGNTSDTMLKQGVSPEHTITELFKYGGSPERCIYPTKSKNLDIMPCNLHLFMMEDFLRESENRLMDLKIIFETNPKVFKDYDFIIIDSPPNFGPFMLNAISASDYYMVPIEAGSIYSLTGLHTLEQVIENHLKDRDINVQLLGYVLNQYDGRTIASKEMLSQARHFYKELLFDTVIRNNTTVKRAQACKKTVHQLEPHSYGAIDFNDLAKEFIKKVKLNG